MLDWRPFVSPTLPVNTPRPLNPTSCMWLSDQSPLMSCSSMGLLSLISHYQGHHWMVGIAYSSVFTHNYLLWCILVSCGLLWVFSFSFGPQHPPCPSPLAVGPLPDSYPAPLVRFVPCPDYAALSKILILCLVFDCSMMFYLPHDLL